MSANSKEGFSASNSPSESESPWDILKDSSEAQTATDEDVVAESAPVKGDIREAKPSPEQIEIRRLRRALDIIEAYYFDKVSISPKDQAFIDEMGGTEAMIKRMEFELSETYDKYSLMKIYFEDKSKLIDRQRVAIRYWARQRGMSVESYMRSEQIRYNKERKIAIGVARRVLIDTGSFKYAELGMDDADAVYYFDDKELIQAAKKQMYEAKRDEILPYLAGRRVNNETGYTPDREARFAIEYLMQKTGLTREQLERRMASYAQEVYLPSRTQEKASQLFVESKADLISDTELERCVDALGRPPREDLTAMLRTVEQVVTRKLGLIGKGITVKIETNPLVTGSSHEYGSYTPSTKTVVVYAGYIIKQERGIAGHSYAQFRCCNTMAHELFHAYQDAYKKDHDDKRSQMYTINDSDYMDGEGPGQTYADYQRQLVEREAWHFGGTISNRIKNVYGRKRGFIL